jgi:hypothetical protein
VQLVAPFHCAEGGASRCTLQAVNEPTPATDVKHIMDKKVKTILDSLEDLSWEMPSMTEAEVLRIYQDKICDWIAELRDSIGSRNQAYILEKLGDIDSWTKSLAGVDDTNGKSRPEMAGFIHKSITGLRMGHAFGDSPKPD